MRSVEFRCAIHQTPCPDADVSSLFVRHRTDRSRSKPLAFDFRQQVVRVWWNRQRALSGLSTGRLATTLTSTTVSASPEPPNRGT